MEQEQIDINNLTVQEKTLIVCMYFSRFRREDERYRGRHEYFKVISEHFNRKVSTLKNDKDAFDAYFDNGRKGWTDKPLEKRSKVAFDVFNKFKDLSVEEHERVVNEIMESIKVDNVNFYSIKTKDAETVDKILSKSRKVTFSGLNVLKEDLHNGQPVFIVLGGDKPKWETGLIGIGIISNEPYDEGYDTGNLKNYKIDVDIEVLLEHPIKRADLIPYKDTYGIIGIGPITKWEPNQAITHVGEAKKAVALMRAMLDLEPKIEEDLEKTIGNELLERVKGTAIKFVPVEVDFGEDIKDEIEEEDFQEEYEEIFEPEIQEVLREFTLDEKIIVNIKNDINASKHIIMTGVPGTGKTTIAERLSNEAVKKNYVKGYITTTAIADWSVFDTIGGYMPNSSGELEFCEGIFLKSIRENKWLIIDEINRSEVDKAFGHFFTVLSGKDVELQYKVKNNIGEEKNISIKHIDKLMSFYDAEKAIYYIGKNWRIIATMNTYDKNSLFIMSYAFMRRFAFVYILEPSEQQYNELISSKIEGHDDIKNILMTIIKTSPRKIGAAIVIDIINYLKVSDYQDIVHGISSILIPQYEGITLSQIKSLYKNMKKVLSPNDRGELRACLCEFFDVESKILERIETEEDEEE